MSTRDRLAFMVFSAWTISGLFLDGWAHRAGKPETFFTPWHGVLYSGFLAGMAWSVLTSIQDRRAGRPVTPPDRLVSLGGLLFLAAGAFDMAWHTLFGVEEDFEALLSPSHLLLMFAGMLLTTGVLRAAPYGDEGDGGSLVRFLPTLAGASLTTALVGFFLMFLTPFLAMDDLPAGEIADMYRATGILVTNVLLLVPLLYLARRFRLPTGTVTLHLLVVIGLISSLDAFDRWPLLLTAIGGGVVGDVLLARSRGVLDRRALRTFAVAVPTAMWLAYALATQLAYGLDQPVEYWTGPIVFAALSGFALALLADDA